MPSFGILYLTTLLVFTQAGPVYKFKGPNTCSLQCSDNNKFNYQPGMVYQFSYNGKTTTRMNGASEDSATINMRANVEIEPITKCDFIMRINDASLQDSEDDQNSQAFKEAMMKQPLKFSFQDGRIDHVCAMDEEQPWTLNIKRGILSAFQNSMDSFDRNQNVTETDVVGSCVSEYKILDEGRRVKLLKKSKNLLGCTDREGYRLAVQSIGYNVPSFVKSLPLMKSEYKCTQTLDLDSNILQSSTCSEEHVFRPFSYGKNGAMTSSEQTLTFINKRKSGRPSNELFSQRSTLLFHHEHNTPSKQEKEEKIEAKLQELCQKAVEDIRPEVPEMVNQLIEHMRQVDRDVLSRVYDKINQKTICAPKADHIKQYFHDAIPMVGTAASVGMIQDLISKKHVTGAEAEMWLLSLSFVHHPTKEMVAATMPLLDESDVSGNVLLAVSSLASSYCNVQPECGKDAEISALIRKLMVLTHDCNAQNGDIKRIVFALRALGNIGHSHEAVSHLSRCVTRRDVPEEIRIAAMDAFRRIPCDAVRSDLMGVFRDESEDSEIRINAYIALMKCPSQKVLSEVRQVLEKEKSNQVGSFVWSHLTNLMETSDPHMQDIRNIVQDEELKKEFNLDQRKFSRNYEGSFFFDSINTGAKVDSNVIFSQKSFIPRSANLNLTIDLFGQAINFLEFGGRVQGMETILENFFRPTATKEPKLKTQNPNNFDKKMDEFHASAYMRIFGNELRYWDEKTLIEFQSLLKRLMNMQTVSFSKTMVLLDSRMTIPTCIGLPLSLTMSSTGSMSLDANASFQKSISLHFTPSASVQVTGEMSVDAHVSKAGLKMVTVAHTSTGAKLDIHNNKFDLQIPQKKMEIFNLKTDFYIVHRNSEKKQKMIVDNVKKHEICTGKLIKQVTGLTFCQNIMFPNASSHNEAPFFPFTGPVVYDLHMINEDAPNGYQIEGFTKQSPYSFYMDTPNSKVSRRIAVDTAMKNKNEASITFMAPWKNIKIEGTVANMDEMKKLTGKMSLNERTQYEFNAEMGMKNTKGVWSFTPKFEITIPQKKMTYEGKIELNPMKTLMIDMSAMGFIASDINLKVSGEIVPKEIGLTSQLKIGKKEYYIASRLGRLVTKSGFKYSPSLKITIPSKDLVEFTSEILYQSNKKMSFDFKLNKVLPKTIAMNAIVLLNAGKTKTKHILKVLFKSPRGNFRIIGDVDNKKTGITSRVIGSYNFGAKYSDRLTLSSKIRDLSVKKSVRYMGNIGLASKKNEFLNFNLKGQMAKAINHLETKFDLHYGNPKIKTNLLKFACVLNRALKPFSHAYDYAMSVQHPGQNIDSKIQLHHLQSATWPFKKFENTATVQLSAKNVVKTSFSYNNQKEKGFPSYTTDASISYQGREIKISDKIVQSGAKSFANFFNVQWQKDGHVSVYSSYNKTKDGVYNTETTVSLSEDKEMKFTGMMHATQRAYKSKVVLEADAGLISNKREHYMAKSVVHYTSKAAAVISSDASFDIMWAEDQKISGTCNLKYTKDVSFSGRVNLLTPFDVMKSFETKIKWAWENNKISAILTSSLNNKIDIKQDFSFNYPTLQLSYSSYINFLGKKSDITIGLNDSSFDGTMRISENKEIISDITVRYFRQKSDGKIGAQLRFSMFGSSGKVDMNTKIDPRKKTMELDGAASFQLPLQELRQISASYNLKHNNHLSSIDMSYSSSMPDYRNGKILIEMKKNLPKMLKATVNLTLNGNPMVNINGNYGKKKDNIDMKVDVTGPSGETNTASGNVNLSGDRKTTNFEIKSRYVDFSVDGSFEYQSPRSVDGELKVTTNGKSVMINVNYKKEGTTHKVIGTLGLPDGRPLKMEASLDLQNNLVALKTMSPDFPELTEVDLAFSFKGDKRMFSSTVSMKVMPYLDPTQFEIKFTKKRFSIGMKSKFESMRQAKFTITFDGDWVQSQQIKAVFQLNNEEMVDLDLNYNFNSIDDFAVTVAALSSHRRYKEFQFELKNKGPFSGMKSSLKIKLANVFMFDAMFQNSRKVSKLSIDGQILDFDEWKSTFELKDDLNSITANIITSIAKKEVNKIEANLKNFGRSINFKVSGPNTVNYELNVDVDTEAITFNMKSSFTLDGQHTYDMIATYEHLSKLHIKVSIPYYEDELLITFAGNLKAFNMQSKFSHNNQIFELILSNKQYYRQMDGILNTPYFQDTVSLKFNGELEQMNIVGQVMHNQEKFELTFSNSGYYQQIDAKLDTPYFQPTLQFSLTGNPQNFNVELKINFDGQIYEMKASNEEYFRKMNFLLETPQLNCYFRLTKNGGYVHVSYAKTKCELKIRKGDNSVFSFHFKKSGFNNYPIVGDRSWPSILSNQFSSLEEGKIEISSSTNDENVLALVLKSSSDNIRKINATLSSQGNSIFAQEIKSQIVVNNNQIVNANLVYNIKSVKDLSGSFNLQSSRSGFTDVSIVLKHLQEPSNWESVFKVKLDRQIIFESKLRMFTSSKQSSFEATLKIVDVWKVLFDKELSGRIIFSQKQKSTINAVITIPEDFNFEFKSELDIEKASFDLRSRMELKQNEIYKIFATYEHVTKLHVKFSVPSYNGELKMAADEDLSTLNSSLKLKLANILMFDAMFQNSRKVSKLSIDGQILDFDEWKSTFELKGDLNSITANIITSIAKKEVNKIEANLKNFGRSINFKVSGPNTVNYELNVDVDTEAITFNMKSSFTLDGQHTYDMIATYEHLSKLHIKVSIPYYEDELLITFAGNLKAFNMQSKFSHNNQIFELILSNKQYYRQMDGILNTPYFQDTVSLKFNGELEQMNIVGQVMHNQEKFELTFSNSGYYQQIDAKLDTPYFQPTLKFSLTGNPQKFNVELKINFDQQIYEMKASNEEYFRKMNFLLETPQLNCNFRLTQNGGSFYLSYAKTKCELELTKGDNYEFVFRLTNPRFNLEREEIYEVVVTYEHLAKLYIKSSFPSYNDELLLTLNGDLKMFNALAKLIHNTNKYELIISNESYYRKMEAQLITPFFTEMASFIFNGDQETFNAQVKFMHNKDNGNVDKPTFKIDLLFKFDAGSNKFYSGSEMNCCDKIYKLIIESDNYYEGMSAKLSIPSFEMNTLIKFNGNLKLFNSTARLNENQLFDISVTSRDNFRQMNVEVSTPFSRKLFMFHSKSTGNTFALDASVTEDQQKTYHLTVVSRGFYRNTEVVLNTPFFQQTVSFNIRDYPDTFDFTAKGKQNQHHYRLTVTKEKSSFKINANATSHSVKKAINLSFNGNMQSFNTLAQFLNNNDNFQLTVSNVNYYRQIKAELLTPYFKDTLDFLFNGNLKKFNTQLTMQHNKIVYEMKASNRDFYQQFDLKVNLPFLHCGFEYSLEMAKKIFLFTIEDDKYEMTFYSKKSFQFSGMSLTTPQHKLKINNKIYQKKKGISVIVNVQLDGRAFTLTCHYKDAKPKHIFNANLKSPFFTASFKSSSIDKGKKSQANQKPLYERMLTQSKDFYNDLDFNFKKPGMKMQFSFKGNLMKCKVVSSLKMATDLYEVILSNQNYIQSVDMVVSIPQIENFKLSFDCHSNAYRFDFAGELSFPQRKTKYVLDMSSKIQKNDHVIKLVGPQININGQFNGDLKSFSLNANAALEKEKYEIMASTKDYFREITGKLSTPQFGEQSLTVKINGQLNDFNGFIEVKNNNEVYRSEFSLVDTEFSLSLPIMLEKLQMKFKGNWKNFESVMEIMTYQGERIEISVTNKNFKEMTAHLTIPRVDDINVLVKTNGNLRNGKSAIKVSVGENMFETEVEINFDGSQANFEIEPKYNILGRSGKAELKIDLMFDAQTYKYEFESDIEGHQIKSMGSVKISPEISVLMTVNIPTLDSSEMKLRIVSEGFHKTDMMLNLKSPWTGMTNIFYEHNGQMGQSFNTKGYIERDGTRFAGYSLSLAEDYSFDFKWDYNNSENIFETKCDWKIQGRKRMVLFRLKTPFRNLKEFSISAGTKMSRDGQIKTEVDVTVSNQQYSFNMDLTDGAFNALFNVDMDKKNKDKQYQFQTSYKNNDQRGDVSRSFNFKLVLPQRTVSLASHFENAQKSLIMSGDFAWDMAKNQKAGFELMILKGNENEGKFRIITPRRTIELFCKVEVNGNHYSTVGHIMMDENNKAQKIDINADIMESKDKVDIDLTVKFPNQKKGMNLKTSVNFPKGDIIFTSNSEFSFDKNPENTFKMSTKLMSENKGKQEMYTIQMDAGHAQTGFAIDLVGRVSSSPEKYHADMEMGYLTAKGEQQKFAIRGELNKVNREVNLKMEAPSKTIELDASLRNKNRYIVSMLKKESDKENMEVLFKLNPKSKKMNIVFNYDEENPDKMYHIDAEVMTTKTLLKAYRANKQNNMIEDATIDAELKTHNILRSTIRWNPHIFHEFNTFGYQKLSMYGRELKSFGNSLSQVLNDEVSMKFSLAKQSFSEDLTPIIDYFSTEYASLSEDIVKAMQNMNEMFQQDMFYMKSSINAMNEIWDEMWIIFNEYLNEMKHDMKDFNMNMIKMMDEAEKQFYFYYDQYSMQFKNKVNELYDYCHKQCEMLYERAMDMKAEIVASIKKYPTTIKELISRMRQNPYGEKVIDFLSTIYEAVNEQTVQAKEHVETLTSAIYSAHAKLNRHIASARRYPMVDAIMDVINEIYQQALWSYNYWDVKNNVLGLKDNLYKFGAEKMKEIKYIVTDVGMNTLVFNPKRGEIMVEIRFGIAKYAYNHFISSVEDIQRAVNKLSNLMPNTDLNVWDIYYMMKPSSDLDDYIPPFKAEASLFAGQHITTFDGRHFNYKGTCSYLLARDFVDGNFTVVANFDSDRKAKTLKSLSITTAHNEQVEIFNDNKVFFNGGEAKLPLQLSDATVTGQGNLIVLESKRGYKVMCDHEIQLYTVKISGWYFNKMAGLFGNFNHEPEDDMLMSNSKYTNDLEQFAQSWSVSQQCKSHRNTAPSHMVPESRECAQFFLQTDSPFRYCFRQVNPDQFYKTCAMQLSSSKATSMDLCKVTSFYMNKCAQKGVYLSTPVMCS